MLCLGKSLVVILNYDQQPDPCGPEPCTPGSGPGPVPWLGKAREHHVFREKLALGRTAGSSGPSVEVRIPRESRIPDPPWGPGPPV